VGANISESSLPLVRVVHRSAPASPAGFRAFALASDAGLPTTPEMGVFKVALRTVDQGQDFDMTVCYL
jgi:hypothetical protein